MKLVFFIAFSVFLNVIVAEQHKKRDAVKEIRRNHIRGEELPHEIYVKRDVEEGAKAKRQLAIPYYPPYNNQQYQCELCCGGVKINGQFPYSVSCCGNSVFDSNSALCCGNNTVSFTPSQNSYQWQCCGNNALYNTSSQLCCGNTRYTKAPLEQCCGSKVFNASKSICCGSTVSAIPTYSTWSCCGEAAYDTTQQQCDSNGNLAAIQQGFQPYQCGNKTINFVSQICCNNQAINRTSNYTLCCGSAGYESSTQICCGNVISSGPSSPTQSCCGNQPMDITTQTCCNNVIVPTPTGTDCSNNYCCGTQLYNSSSQTTLCCNNQLVQIPSSTPSGSSNGLSSGIMIPSYNYYNYQCCGSQVYNTQTQTCCTQDMQNNVVNGVNVNCCGGKSYDASKSTCCNNTLFNIGEVPSTMCCCPNGGCYNNYYPPYPYPYYGIGPVILDK